MKTILGTARELLRRVLQILILALSFVLLADAFWVRSRAFLIEAETTVLSVALETEVLWPVRSSTLCLPESGRRRAEDALCGRNQPQPVDRILTFQAGDLLEIRVERDKGLVVQSSSKAAALEGGFLIMPLEAWTQSGLLTLRGVFTLGKPPSTGGAPELLRSGRYEARENTMLMRGFAERSIVTTQGTLMRGAVVRAEKIGGGHVVASAVISAGGETEDPLLHAVLVTEASKTALLIDFPGAEPVRISPGFMDRILQNPILLMLAFLLPIGLGGGQLLMGTRKMTGSEKT